jgi:hypothetical protein
LRRIDLNDRITGGLRRLDEVFTAETIAKLEGLFGLKAVLIGTVPMVAGVAGNSDRRGNWYPRPPPRRPP